MFKMHFNMRSIDWWLVIPMAILLTIGYIMVFSTTSFKGLSEFNDAYYFIKRHSLFLMLGIALFTCGSWLPVKYYKKCAFWGYLVSVALLLITLIPTIGVKVGGANRWLNFFGVQFQPIEIAKFWWAISVSIVLSKKSQWLHSFKHGMVPVFIIMLLPILCLLLQPDLGNAILTLSVAFALLLVSSLPLMVLLVSVIMGAGMIGYSILTHPYQMQRVQSFLNPWLDPLGKNYHIIQSFTAIGSGGVFGFGIGESRLKYFYLPLHYSDFIFSILCEEGGIMLASMVLLSFLVIFIRGIQISVGKPRYSFEQFLVLALTFYIVFQAMINICVVVGIFPITGIPLTFISYGGTSLLSSLFCLGVVHRVGKMT